MNPEHTKELWRIRFQKIVDLEEESYQFYEKLLKGKGPLLEQAGVKSILKQILSDEGRHIRIAKELLSLAACTRSTSAR